ncbi:MAG: choice-of-anchor C family protein, partial [Candidatus Eremiobacteraeota bacterium]|nr:choice-of-anchor C family protein [Candidatus Eremiobacteraeota bacterium]
MRYILAMILRAWVLTLSFLFCGSAMVSAQPQNLLTNGSFESGVLSGPSSALNLDSNAIAGWRVNRGRVDYIGTFWQASQGVGSIDLDGTPGPGGIAQSFRTVPGQTYMVRFDLAGNPDGPPRFKVMAAAVAGNVRRFTFDISGHSKSAMGWVTRSFAFRASATISTLELYSLDAPGNWNGAAIDNVWVSASGQVPQERPTTVSGRIDLRGVWIGNYPQRDLRVRIAQENMRVTATLLDGNAYVPAGKISWYGDITGPRFAVQQVCAHRDYVAPEWHRATVTVVNQNTLDLGI